MMRMQRRLQMRAIKRRLSAIRAGARAAAVGPFLGIDPKPLAHAGLDDVGLKTATGAGWRLWPSCPEAKRSEIHLRVQFRSCA